MPKVDGSPTKGEITAAELLAAKQEVNRLGQQLVEREQALAEKLAAADLAEQLRESNRIHRQDREDRRQSGEKLPAHRPSDYTEEAAGTLCQWIAEGGSLRKWSAQTGIPPMKVYRWMGENASFRERYALAHESRTDTFAEDMLDIADEVAGTDSIAAVKAAQLRIDTRKWIASKLRPQKWGDKQVIEQTGTVTFNLGIPSSTPSPLVIDGNSLIQKGNSRQITDSQSDALNVPSSIDPLARPSPSSPIQVEPAESPPTDPLDAP
jgi:hypothetical protein